jgi:ABC-type amino acid transport substrate-binding protein
VRVALLAALFLAAAVPARAQDVVLTGTLKDIAARGAIRLGVRTGAVPFSFRNRAGQPVGFSVDLCHGIAADVAAALSLDLVEPDAPAWQTGVRIAYVPVTADERLPMVRSGAIDVECGSTTDTAERARSVAFSPVFFLAGTKLLAAPPVASWRDAHSIAVSAGTTTDAVVQRVAAAAQPPIKVVETPDVPAAYAMLVAGTVDAVASDDVLLSGLVASTPEGHRFRVVGDFLSFEPYALPIRRDDPDFAGLVASSFARMASDGTLSARYRRWFIDRLPDGEDLNLPMSAQLTEMYRALGQGD